MKRIENIFFIFLSFCFTSSGFASFCENLPGKWSGNWENQLHQHYLATLSIQLSTSTSFAGKYRLSNQNKGAFRGKCSQLTASEAYLRLVDDPPWFNPCRGVMIQTKDELMLHIFCYKPNQSGYFIKH